MNTQQQQVVALQQQIKLGDQQLTPIGGYPTTAPGVPQHPAHFVPHSEANFQNL